MKSQIFIFLFMFIVFNTTFSQTNVSGFISSNTTWTLSGSPYIIVGNALLSQGYTLTIDPGVIVKFEIDKALQIDGELIAKGTVANRITFTSNQASPVAGDWAKIHFSDLSTNAVFDVNGNYISGSIMKYCNVLYGGSLGFGEIHIINSSPYFSHCNIMNSINDGIYCSGASYLIDSSNVKNCSGHGLSFYQIQLTSCGLTVLNDTIENNFNGGIYIENGASSCPTLIKNNYFSSNSQKGAVHYYNPVNDAKITENIFYNNNSNISVSGISISGNNIVISKNYFENNSSNASSGSIIVTSGSNDSIKCNRFISNQTGVNGAGVILAYGSFSSIENNIFIGNINNSQYGVAVVSVNGSTSTSSVSFINNTVKNNYSPTGYCCKFNQQLYGQNSMTIKNNEFTNNIASNVIYMSTSYSSINNFLNFKYNNLKNPSAQYEFFNNIPYGSPNLSLDSNYWGSTSTQHIDSVIYDYFDDASKSVVYYMPYLSSAIVIDTTCPPTIITETLIYETFNYNSVIFPNPFSQKATISFSNELEAATFRLYNLLGNIVQLKNNIYGKEIVVDRQRLDNGIYFYEVSDKQKIIYTGKAVVY